MYFEQVFVDRIYLVHINESDKPGQPEVIAVANRGLVQELNGFEWGRDRIAFDAFRQTYGRG